MLFGNDGWKDFGNENLCCGMEVFYEHVASTHTQFKGFT